MATRKNGSKVTLVGELSSKALAFSVDALLAEDKKHETSTTEKDKTTRLRIQVELTSRELWKKFHRLGTEMIITKAGRRMFPTIKVNFRGMEPQVSYIVFLDIVPKDNKRYRYVYHSSQWSVAGAADPPLSPAIFVHPESPSSGRLWMAQGVVAFDKLKLTNNRKPIVRGQVSLHSMHKYQPRVHVLPTGDVTTPTMTQAMEALRSGNVFTFTFPETVFTTVTAYQNQQITRLKIASNPFAKGFREASRKGEVGAEEQHHTVPTTTPLIPAFLPIHMTTCPMTPCQLAPCPLLRRLVSQTESSHPPLDLRRRF